MEIEMNNNFTTENYDDGRPLQWLLWVGVEIGNARSGFGRPKPGPYHYQ